MVESSYLSHSHCTAANSGTNMLLWPCQILPRKRLFISLWYLLYFRLTLVDLSSKVQLKKIQTTYSFQYKNLKEMFVYKRGEGSAGANQQKGSAKKMAKHRGGSWPGREALRVRIVRGLRTYYWESTVKHPPEPGLWWSSVTGPLGPIVLYFFLPPCLELFHVNVQ